MSDDQFRAALQLIIEAALNWSSLLDGTVVFIGKGETQRYVVTVTQEPTEAPNDTVH